MKILVRVPATTANLGPGFDALGLALDRWNDAIFSLREDGQTQVKVQGEGQGRLPTGEDNLIAASARRVYDLANVPFTGMEIECVNRIPLGSGLGSSSAAILTGMLGANRLLNEPFPADDLLQHAIEIEGHPDNLAPAMLGGLVVSMATDGNFISRRLDSINRHKPLHATIVLPEVNFPTAEARQVLPDRVSMQGAAENIGRAVMVTEALRSGDMELLGAAMQDSLHQPYRLPLIPGAAEALEAAREAGAAAAALSGAGPALIAFSEALDPAIGAAMQTAFSDAGIPARIMELKTSDRGASVQKV